MLSVGFFLNVDFWELNGLKGSELNSFDCKLIH